MFITILKHVFEPVLCLLTFGLSRLISLVYLISTAPSCTRLHSSSSTTPFDFPRSLDSFRNLFNFAPQYSIYIYPPHQAPKTKNFQIQDRRPLF